MAHYSEERNGMKLALNCSILIIALDSFHYRENKSLALLDFNVSSQTLPLFLVRGK